MDSGVDWGLMSKAGATLEWIQEELATVHFNDQRLDDRMGLVLEALSQKPQASPRAACSGLKEMTATYRFFDNPKVTPKRVLAPHREATLERMGEYRRVLAIQDTTELDFSGRQEIEGAGFLSGPHSQGFYLHPLLVVTEERLCLGSVWAKFYVRPKRGIRKTRKQRPFAQKESVRWLEGYRQACAAARELPHTQVVAVSDAESDIYEVLVGAQPEAAQHDRRAEYLIRAAQDRRTAETEGRLWAEMTASPVLGEVEVDLPRRGERPARKASLQLHAKAVTLRPPYRPQGQELPALKVWAVLAQEVAAPAGAEPVEWLLLSSQPIESFEAAIQALEWYLCRWEIEVFFRVFKSGCQVEKLQFREDERFLPAFGLYLIIAWRILYLTMLGRVTPELSCAAVFEAAEWQAVWTVSKKASLPPQPPRLAEMIGLIACLGGYKGTKSEGPPGPKAMWEGLRRTYDLAWAWQSFGPGAPACRGAPG